MEFWGTSNPVVLDNPNWSLMGWFGEKPGSGIAYQKTVPINVAEKTTEKQIHPITGRHRMNGEKHLVARLQHDLHSGIQPPKQKTCG